MDVRWATELPANVSVIRDVPYGDALPQAQLHGFSGRQQEGCLKNCVDIYHPTDRTIGEELPVLVHVHGGGWIRGDRAAGLAPSAFSA